MKAPQEILDLLNEVLTAELTAVNQYFVHAKLCQNWGYTKLGDIARRESIEEMVHAEKVMERILYLDGRPNVERLGEIRIGDTVRAQFESDLQLERAAVDRYNRGIDLCQRLGDHGTREMLAGFLVDEEQHVDWIETQLSVLDALGDQLYLAQYLGDASSD